MVLLDHFGLFIRHRSTRVELRSIFVGAFSTFPQLLASAVKGTALSIPFKLPISWRIASIVGFLANPLAKTNTMVIGGWSPSTVIWLKVTSVNSFSAVLARVLSDRRIRRNKCQHRVSHIGMDHTRTLAQSQQSPFVSDRWLDNTAFSVVRSVVKIAWNRWHPLPV